MFSQLITEALCRNEYHIAEINNFQKKRDKMYVLRFH